jgi:NADH dehydrogenase/NADH:ubiquinone oxidoreductase subunit G
MKLTINNVPVTARDGVTILEAARENGIEIPTLCYLKDFSPVGACRICVVEVEGSRALVGSCHTPAVEGMVVQTHSPKVLAARKVLVELMMASHPDVCIVCNAANCCEFRRLAADLDIGLPRFRTRKHFYAIEDENPFIVRDMSKCILCRRCVTTCRNKNGKSIFSIAYRGFESKVIFKLDQPVGGEDTCLDCDACITGCPTGALRKPFKTGEAKDRPVVFLKG